MAAFMSVRTGVESSLAILLNSDQTSRRRVHSRRTRTTLRNKRPSLPDTTSLRLGNNAGRRLSKEKRGTEGRQPTSRVNRRTFTVFRDAAEEEGLGILADAK